MRELLEAAALGPYHRENQRSCQTRVRKGDSALDELATLAFDEWEVDLHRHWGVLKNCAADDFCAGVA